MHRDVLALLITDHLFTTTLCLRCLITHNLAFLPLSLSFLRSFGDDSKLLPVRHFSPTINEYMERSGGGDQSHFFRVYLDETLPGLGSLEALGQVFE